MVPELKLPFLPLCSSPKIMLAMRTLLYGTEMNPLSVENQFLQTVGVRSTSLSSSKQKCQYNAIFNSVQNWCIALSEFRAGSAIIASVHCCCSPHCFSSKEYMPLPLMSYCFIHVKHHLLRMNAFAPLTLKTDFFFFFSDV